MKIEYVHGDFDPEHYPLEQWHLNQLAAVQQHFNLPDTTTWYYQATTHSRVFWFKFEKKHHDLYNRFTSDTIQFLAKLDGFRWIECHDDNLSFSLAHTVTTSCHS